VKAAAAVLGASLLFFVGVLTGAGRREAVPPPAAIPLGATNQPGSASGTLPSSPGAPDGGTKRTATTTARAGAPAPTPATTSAGPAGATPSTVTSTPGATTVPTAASSTTTTGSGQVQQVDNQVDCSSTGNRGKGKREPCPSSTTSSTRGAPGGDRNG